MKKTLFIFLLFLLSAISYPQYKSDFKIADSSYKPFFDFDNSGNIHMVWNNAQKGDWSAQYSAFDSAGNIVYQTRKISNTLAASGPSLAIKNDLVACVWEDMGSLVISDFNSYIKGKVLKDGLDFSNELTFNDSYGDAHRRYPSIIWHNDSILYATWAGEGSQSFVKGYWTDIYAHKILFPPLRKSYPIDAVLNNSWIKVKENYPQVIRKSSGSGYLALWVEYDSINNVNIAGVTCDDSLRPASSKIIFASFNDIPSAWMSKPAVFHRANGNIIIAWEKDTANYKANIYLQEFTESGRPVGSMEKVNENEGYDEVSADIDLDGNSIIVWGEGVNLIAQRYSSDMVKLGTNFRLNTLQTLGNTSPCTRLRNRKIYTAWRGSGGIMMNILNFDDPTSIEKEREEFPQTYSLSQNYPNPFNPSTRIQYSVVSNQNVNLKVYDVLGNEVAILVNEEKQPGTYEVEFSGQNSVISNGVYFYQLRAGDFIQTKKMIILK
jgi:hypothetical protein